MMNSYQVNRISDYLTDSARLMEKSANLALEISCVVDVIVKALKSGNKILWCGNGGSAADSQHLAAELVGKYKLDRKALNSIALTTDTSILTAIGNDFGFERIFSRQIEAIGHHGDILIALTTSGKSLNILKALEMAKEVGIHTILLTGNLASENLADFVIKIDSEVTEKIQQCHTAIGHIICELVEFECSK